MRRFLYALALLVGLGSCGTSEVTQVVLVIEFEPGALEGASRVEVRVIGGVGRRLDSPQPVFSEVVDLSRMSTGDPWVLGLAPVNEQLDRAFEATVVVRDAADVLLLKQTVVSSYVTGRTLELRLNVEQACRGVSCPDHPTTCRMGICLDPWIDPTTLPSYSASSTQGALEDPGDAG